jgi:hypothetical protein
MNILKKYKEIEKGKSINKLSLEQTLDIFRSQDSCTSPIYIFCSHCFFFNIKRSKDITLCRKENIRKYRNLYMINYYEKYL